MTVYERVPILELWGIVLVPIQGEMSDTMASALCEEVLGRVHVGEIRAVVIDLTGAWMIDSHLCATLSRLASSAALMGTRTLFSGMSPEAAMTLQSMGIEMPDVESAQSLESALELVGVRRVEDEEGADHEEPDHDPGFLVLESDER